MVVETTSLTQVHMKDGVIKPEMTKDDWPRTSSDTLGLKSEEVESEKSRERVNELREKRERERERK